MKVFCFFIGALGASSADVINCPARCWEYIDGQCRPMADKIELDCSTVGSLLIEADSCLFTPDNANYAQNYTVFFGGNPSTAPPCVQSIGSASDVLSFNLTYSEAEQCGWAWATENDTITFANSLRPSENVNKITVNGITLTISDFPEDIDLKCVYDRKASVSVDFFNAQSTAAQKSNRTRTADFDDGFSVQLFQGNQPQTTFTVGEQITADFWFDHGVAGYSSSQMPFGFFTEKCLIKNAIGQGVYLVGSGDRSHPDTCLLDQSILNLHADHVYQNATDQWDVDKSWSTTKYKLRFDSFKLGGSSNLSLTCDFQICLSADCDVDSNKVCDQPINGTYENWASWSSCSATCGLGFQTRTRQCSGMQNGGLDCAQQMLGPSTMTQNCILGPCKDAAHVSTVECDYHVEGSELGRLLDDNLKSQITSANGEWAIMKLDGGFQLNGQGYGWTIEQSDGNTGFGLFFCYGSP